jgi:thymidylate synthase (FAD)
MSVRLISYSQTTENLHVGNDIQELVAYCARVSNPSNQINEETSAKLLRYLAQHKHWSPFEMVSACLEIETTRDIARQILRHRSFSFQEFSQRYANPVEDLEFVRRGARLQDPKNRQNSIDAADIQTQDMWDMKQQEVIAKSKEVYNWAIEQGIAKEQARSVLPEGLTMSRLYVNGTLRSWIHFIDLRSGNGTQREHMAIAQACAKAISQVFPTIEEFANGD